MGLLSGQAIPWQNQVFEIARNDVDVPHPIITQCHVNPEEQWRIFRDYPAK